MNDREIDKDADDYSPNNVDMRLTVDEWTDIETDHPIKYELMCKQWRDARRKERVLCTKRKDAKLETRLLTHWYNKLTDSEVVDLALSLGDEAKKHIDKVLEKETLDSKRRYYYDLKEKIGHINPKKNPAHYGKLKTFPQYEPSSRLLFGCSRYMVNFLAHVYSLKY